MQDWQSIETAPKDGTSILIWNGEHTIGYWAVSVKNFIFEGWTTGWETVSGYDVGYNQIYGATHWMRLPLAPK